MAVGGARVEIAAEPEGASHPSPVVPQFPVDRCLGRVARTRAKKPVVVHGEGEREVSVDGEGPLVAVHRNPGPREAIRRIGRAEDLHRLAVLELRLEAHGPALVDYSVIAANGAGELAPIPQLSAYPGPPGPFAGPNSRINYADGKNNGTDLVLFCQTQID